MRIYTKTGDDGTTGRLYGGRVPKTDVVVDAVGDVDETIAVLGLARAHASEPTVPARASGGVAAAADPAAGLAGDPAAGAAADFRANLAEWLLLRQRELFVLGADISVNPERRHKLTPGISLLTSDDVAALEKLIDDVVAAHPLRPVFIVPGATVLSAHLDHARTIARRAERTCLAARESGSPISDDVLQYLNRLSDLLFVLARAAAGDAEEPASHD